MKKKIQLLPVVIITLCVAALSVFGSMATDARGEWFRSLAKPSWNPPNWLFAPVWTTIYVLLIVSASIIWYRTQGSQRSKMMWLFAINGIFNLAWSFAFFQAQSTHLGLVDIILVWITILLLVIRTWPISRTASFAVMPYLGWVSFATVLNASIMILNR